MEAIAQNSNYCSLSIISLIPKIDLPSSLDKRNKFIAFCLIWGLNSL